MDIVRLCANDYDEWLNVLNTTFGKQNNRETNFEKSLPKMCIRDDYHMGMHFGVKDNGKLCALLGVYPLRLKIGGEDLLFATVGNVATLPEYEGRGYMKALMGEAMEELKRIGADVSRLGGVRHRYNRYGYEMSGTVYNFMVDTATNNFRFNGEELDFKEITLESNCELEFINKLRKSKAFYVERSFGDTYQGDYLTLKAWESAPYIALNKNGEMKGYLSVSPDKTSIRDVYAVDFESLKAIIFNWQKGQDKAVEFTFMPSDYEEIKYFTAIAETVNITSPSHYKVINFDKIANALIKLKLSYTPNIPDGESILGIEGWGNLKISVNDGKGVCEKTNETPHIVLDNLSATRFLFGPFPPETVTATDKFLSSVLPLPLSWNTLDRV